MSLTGSKPRLLHLSLLLATVLAIVLLLQADAHAQTTADPDYWKQTTTRSQTVYSFLYRQSPQAVPTSYSPASGPASSLTTDFRSLPSTNPQVEPLWRQTRKTLSASQLSPALRALGTIGLTVGAFDLGWKIGSGLNAKFLKIGIPANGTLGDYYSPQIDFRQAGERSQLWYQIPVPEDAWVWSIYSSAFSWQRSMEYRGAGTTNCPWQIFAPPAGFTEVSIPMGCGDGPGSLRIAYMPEDGLAAKSSIQDYTTQPYDYASPAPTPPPQTTVEEAMEEQLEKPENESLRQWLNRKLGSPREEDPLGVDPPNPDIEFPGFFTHWEDHGDEFATPYEDPLEYWRDAAEIVESGDNGNPDFLKCERSDGALIYWDSAKRAIVIVKDGKIVTFFRPAGPPPADFNYYLNECSS